jgi:tetratricopeptide (TPR) repeat protein
MGFDLGATGGKPTIPPPKADEFESDQVPPTIEIFDTMRARFPSLAKDYGPFALHHPGVTMVFHVVQRVENVTGSRVFWDETVDKEALLAFEFRGLPGDQGTQSRPCDDVLRATVEPLGLSVRVIRRDRGGELIEASNDCFNELRKFGMDTSYAEEAMFNLAVNFFYLKDYEKMKLVLREYLRVYDTPSHRRYYDACFWLGWLFERDRKFREAIKNYTLAAEEKLVLYRRAADEPLPPAEELKKRLSYDTLFSLMLKANGLFKDARLGDQFVSFIRFNTNVDVKLDPAAAAIETLINRDPFVQVPCFDLLYGVMAELGLGLRAENGDAAVAEKSYFRMAATYKKDNLLQEALEHVDTLLRRFPETGRKFDAHKLRLDIFRGLKDYARAIQTLETLRALVPDETEAYKLDYEAGRIYFDLADYEQAEKYFARVLSNANAEGEWLAVREVLAHTYLRRRETHAKAITEYRSLLQYETSPLRSSVHTLMVYYLESVLASPDLPKPVFPPKEDEFMRKYETLTDRQRQQLSQNDVARVTWIYYTRGLLDLQANRLDDALSQLDAASVSPDAFMAGDALVQAGKIHMGRNQFQKAKDVFQHLLFAIDAAEPTVRATYLLGVCHEKLDQKDAAFRRYEEVLTRFPVSPYAELVKRERLYLERTGQWPPPWAVTNGVGVVSNAIGVAGVTGLVTRTAPATNVAQAAGVPTATNTTATPVPVAAPTNGTQREAKRP